MSTILGRALLSKFTRFKSPVRFTSNYKAAVCKSHDGKCLVFEEKKRPKLKENEVRIQVAYCSVNAFDVGQLTDPQMKFPFIPGYEFSGEVIEVGEMAQDIFKKDDRVVAMNFCGLGGLATECVLDNRDIWLSPPEVQLKDAAVIIYGHSMALFAFGILSPTNEKSSVVVSVGPAGVGLAAVDVAANIYKAKVIAVTDTEVKSELTREKGAFATMHYGEKLEKLVTDTLQGNKADMIFDAVGGKIRDALQSCISSNGKMFTITPGTVSLPPPHASMMGVSLAALRDQNLTLYRQIGMDTLDMAAQGVITAHISEKFDFKDVDKAIDFINSKKCTGKVVVKIN